ncbi:unnamed protein product [Parascedosporium putredinis]|uniref:phosphatidylinositol-3,4,5-trisphosphate 3-phosphatase n=1 Tax=Parascedosporium putredinis TaxID=1442378 RepID=A0A9P1MAW1_9PEZI|nr:unnamed protein product [Parascedosporium putredinis]CAI7995102.1 unnamed protein product [Parascedosporium putredinis]
MVESRNGASQDDPSIEASTKAGATQNSNDGSIAIEVPIGPHPGTVTVPEQYIFEQNIRQMQRAAGSDPTREDSYRLQGVQMIDNVRKALQLPVRTFNTAVVYYHRFRLRHREVEYNFQDSALAALFLACKVEDTIKKAKDILCAAYNLKNPEHQTTPDDKLFEQSSRVMVGLERMMLEIIGFDFRTRHPQKYLIKVVRTLLGPEQGKSFLQIAYEMCMDMYKTFVPIKQTCLTMVLAIVELTSRVTCQYVDVMGEINPSRWNVTRQSVMETILDLLDLYTQFHKSTKLGQRYDLARFIDVKIKVNAELDAKPELSRHEFSCQPCAERALAESQAAAAPGAGPGLITALTMTATYNPLRTGNKSSESTLRLVFDREQARREAETVSSYFKEEYEEIEVEVEELIPEPDRFPENQPNPLAWFLGHLTLILCTVRYAFSWLRFNYYGGMAKFSYRTSFIAAALTYGIVVYKTFKARTKSGAPPKVVSAPTSSPNGKPQYAPNPLSDKIGAFVRTYYDDSMAVVSSLEILLWVRILLSAITFQKGSWILIAIYTVFLRARFAQSTHVQNSFQQFETKIDGLVGSQGTPCGPPGLDLCYVTENIIVTSGPSQSYPKRAYRNPLDQVVAFLDEKHGEDWAIWEFRAEGTGYPDEAVYGRILHYPNWLHGGQLKKGGVGGVVVGGVSGVSAANSTGTATQEDGGREGSGGKGGEGDGEEEAAKQSEAASKRVVVVHCKAGKGRSGTVSCSYLIAECGWKPADALARFTERRMRPGPAAASRSRDSSVERASAGSEEGGSGGGDTSAAESVSSVKAKTKKAKAIIRTLSQRATGNGAREGPRGDKAGTGADGIDLAELDPAAAAAPTSRASNLSPPGRISTTEAAHRANPPAEAKGGAAVILKPGKPVVVSTSDVKISARRSAKAPTSMGPTFVTSVAHAWFNVFFEGQGPELRGRPESSGVFEIGWDDMDGLKGMVRMPRSFDRVAVVWRAVGAEEEVRQPEVVEEVPEVRAADWKGRSDVELERVGAEGEGVAEEVEVEHLDVSSTKDNWYKTPIFSSFFGWTS